MSGFRLVPPANEVVADANGNHTDAWGAHHQEVCDFLATLGVGTTKADDAKPGNIGEFFSTVVTVGTPVHLGSFVPGDVGFLDLPAGDFDLWGSVVFAPQAATTFNTIAAWISVGSATLPGDLSDGGYMSIRTPFTASAIQAIPAGRIRFSLAVTTRIYMSALAGPVLCDAYGAIRARRMR